MLIRLKQDYPPSADLISRYQRLLQQSRKILDDLSINVEEIIHAKINALPKSSLSPRVHVVNPEVIVLSLNKEFKIMDYDKSVDLSKLLWKYSCLRASLIGNAKDIRAVFTLVITYNNDLKINAYGNDFDGFNRLVRKANLDLSPIISNRKKKRTKSLCY